MGRNGNEFWETIDSTNSRALELARNNASHGIIVIAQEQTAGRGRNGRSWFSPAGSGLYISFLLRPQTQLANIPVITLVTGVATAQAIQKCLNIRPGLKWVNDLILDDKKIGGILCEYQTIGPTRTRAHLQAPLRARQHSSEAVGAAVSPPAVLIVGIGLNLYPPKTKLPPDLDQKIGFLQSNLPADHSPINPNHLIASIADELEIALDQMQSDNLKSLLDQWRAYSITLGEEIIATLGDKQISGQALDITDTGELIVKTNSGNVTFPAGEVNIRKSNGSYI